ncbi:MAG: hypothetical protein U0L20_09155 [Ruminococcus sp.]|nr:hypothetical protein [Ruminococcus sp.]
MENNIHKFELPQINKSNIKLPRMRTIKEAAAELKALDEHTAVTEYHIRQLALSGVLPRVQAGKKLLINLDLLIEYLTNPDADKFRANTHPASDNGIRKII